MRHAAHKAARVSDERFSAAKALFTSSRGSHTAKAVRMVQLANGVAEKLNEVAPMTRRAMREAARAAERRSTIVTSASLAALVGTAATAVALTQQNSMNLLVADAATTTTQLKRVSDTSAASRSEERTALDSLVDSSDASQTSNNGEWQLGDANTIADVSQLSKSKASNPNVAVLMDQDSESLPAGFDSEHATGDSGNAYEFSQCTWWAYVRRHQLGLPVPTSAMDASGPLPRRPWAIGSTILLAMSVTSSCSPQARRVPTPITAMSPSSRRSMTTVPSSLPSAAP